MKKLTYIAMLALLANTGTALAESPAQDGAHPHRMAAAEQVRYRGQGIIKAEKPNKVQIMHEPIAELKWPAMTMWFGLRTTLPAGLHAGEKVRFEMLEAEDGQWVIVAIERM